MMGKTVENRGRRAPRTAPPGAGRRPRSIRPWWASLAAVGLDRVATVGPLGGEGGGGVVAVAPLGEAGDADDGHGADRGAVGGGGIPVAAEVAVELRAVGERLATALVELAAVPL